MKVAITAIALGMIFCQPKNVQEAELKHSPIIIFFEYWPEEPLLRMKPRGNDTFERQQILEIRKDRERKHMMVEWDQDGTIIGDFVDGPFFWETLMDQKCSNILEGLIKATNHLAGIILINDGCNALFRHDEPDKRIQNIANFKI